MKVKWKDTIEKVTGQKVNAMILMMVMIYDDSNDLCIVYISVSHVKSS